VWSCTLPGSPASAKGGGSYWVLSIGNVPTPTLADVLWAVSRLAPDNTAVPVRVAELLNSAEHVLSIKPNPRLFPSTRFFLSPDARWQRMVVDAPWPVPAAGTPLLHTAHSSVGALLLSGGPASAESAGAASTAHGAPVSAAGSEAEDEGAGGSLARRVAADLVTRLAHAPKTSASGGAGSGGAAAPAPTPAPPAPATAPATAPALTPPTPAPAPPTPVSSTLDVVHAPAPASASLATGVFSNVMAGAAAGAAAAALVVLLGGRRA
jgi:hypothetical protein